MILQYVVISPAFDICFVVTAILERKALHCSTSSPSVKPAPSWYTPLNFTWLKIQETKENKQIKKKTMPRSCRRSCAGVQITWLYHMVMMFPYLTFEIMGFGMKHRKEGFVLRRCWSSGQLFATLWGRANICRSRAYKKSDLPTGQLFLQVQGINKNFSPVHI